MLRVGVMNEFGECLSILKYTHEEFPEESGMYLIDYCVKDYSEFINALKLMLQKYNHSDYEQIDINDYIDITNNFIKRLKYIESIFLDKLDVYKNIESGFAHFRYDFQNNLYFSFNDISIVKLEKFLEYILPRIICLYYSFLTHIYFKFLDRRN